MHLNIFALLIEYEHRFRFQRSTPSGNLIQADKDDNKFVDCALACNAKYIVTEDTHFDELKQIDFPKVDVISLLDFMEVLKQLNNPAYDTPAS